MARSPSSEPAAAPGPARTIGAASAAVLLDLAQDAVRAEIDGRRFDHDAPRPTDPALDLHRGVFVTLHLAGALQGCIGTLADDEALGRVVPRVACDAAFGDPRFRPLRPDAFDDLELGLSVLSPRTPLPAATGAALEAALRPGTDGLVLADGRRRALFLPDVWDELPHPAEFVDRLLRKAGLPTDRWSATMQAWRFTTESFVRHVRDRGRLPRDTTRR